MLTTLETRILIADLVEVYRILSSFEGTVTIFKRRVSSKRRLDLKLYKKRVTVN